MNAGVWLRERHDDPGNVEGGFTLIELIITLVLMSLIAGAIGAAFVGSLNATSATKQRVPARGTRTRRLQQLLRPPLLVSRWQRWQWRPDLGLGA